MLLKRDPNACYINNYNKEMILCWNANMDIQLAFDPFAVVTYIVSYVNKDESGTTKFLKEALEANADKSTSEKLKALKMAYITSRQIGWSEAVYKAIPSMKLKDSNIACIFVANGFPENRSVFYRKVKDKKADVEADVIAEDQDESENGESVTIEGRPGEFVLSTSVHDRYPLRPKKLERICLGQFAISYVFAKRISKKADFDQDGSSCEISEQKIFNEEVFLPKYISLNEEKSDHMRLRQFPAVMRTHNPKKKASEHERCYAELLLFTHWRNEVEELKRWNTDECILEHEKRRPEIIHNKAAIYPGEATIDLLESDDIDQKRPVHIYDMLDSQRQQENDDDNEIGAVDDPAYVTFGNTEHFEKEVSNDDFKYKILKVPNDENLRYISQRLAPEQMNILREVVTYCKDVVKAQNNLTNQPKPLKLIVHGGAGKNNLFFFIFMKFENLC